MLLEVCIYKTIKRRTVSHTDKNLVWEMCLNLSSFWNDVQRLMREQWGIQNWKLCVLPDRRCLPTSQHVCTGSQETLHVDDEDGVGWPNSLSGYKRRMQYPSPLFEVYIGRQCLHGAVRTNSSSLLRHHGNPVNIIIS
jgi:hypothetical protein